MVSPRSKRHSVPAGEISVDYHIGQKRGVFRCRQNMLPGGKRHFSGLQVQLFHAFRESVGDAFAGDFLAVERDRYPLICPYAETEAHILCQDKPEVAPVGHIGTEKVRRGEFIAFRSDGEAVCAR